MDVADRLALAQTIRPARKARGWSQEDLSIKSGVGLRTIQGVERPKADRPPSIGALTLLKQALTDPAEPTHQQSKWSPDVDTLLEIVGMFIESLEGEERQMWIDHLTRAIVLRDLDE